MVHIIVRHEMLRLPRFDGMRRCKCIGVSGVVPFTSAIEEKERIVDTLDVFVPMQPDAALSPNARGHWSKRAKANRVARNVTRLSVVSALNALPSAFPREGVLRITPVIHWGKGRRTMDGDNAVSVLKPYIDGIQDALGRDDRWFVVSVPEQVRTPGAPGVVFMMRMTPAGRDRGTPDVDDG